MNRVFSVITAAGLLVSCTVLEKLPGGSDQSGEGPEIPVTGVSITPQSATLQEGETLTLTCKVVPENATNKQVIWVSSNTSVATVQEGSVSGVKAGNAVISVITQDGGETATCAITVTNDPAVTGDAEDVSPVSAVLKGRAILGSSAASDLKVGFQYSKVAGIMPSNSIMVDALAADEHYVYTAGIGGLEPETTYYYRSFVRQNNEDTYGTTKSFTTRAVSDYLLTGPALDVTTTGVTLLGTLDYLDGILFSNLEYGICWGTDETVQETRIPSDNLLNHIYSVTLTELSHHTTYWYKAYLTMDTWTGYGEVQSFTTSSIPAASISLSAAHNTLYGIGRTLSLAAEVLPEDADDKRVVWSSDQEDVVVVDPDSGTVTSAGIGTANITATAKGGSGVSASFEVTVVPDYVDLGLSVKWGTCNIGASWPEDAGDYYAWGEIEPHYVSQDPLTWKDGKIGYDWASYKWCDGTGETITKYGTVDVYQGVNDDKRVLDPEDDVVQVTMAGNWRMPTRDEWVELKNLCTLEEGMENGQPVLTVTGPNGNRMLLPRAGYWNGVDLCFADEKDGGIHYWSSSLDHVIPKYAYHFSLYQGNVHVDSINRPYGVQVRGVLAEQAGN